MCVAARGAAGSTSSSPFREDLSAKGGAKKVAKRIGVWRPGRVLLWPPLVQWKQEQKGRIGGSP